MSLIQLAKIVNMIENPPSHYIIPHTILSEDDCDSMISYFCHEETWQEFSFPTIYQEKEYEEKEFVLLQRGVCITKEETLLEKVNTWIYSLLQSPIIQTKPLKKSVSWSSTLEEKYRTWSDTEYDRTQYVKEKSIYKYRSVLSMPDCENNKLLLYKSHSENILCTIS